MILYLIEFALLHTLFYLVFKLLLSRETQLRFLRFFLLGATLLALIIPSVDIKSSGPIPTIQLESIAFSASKVIQPATSSVLFVIPWYIWIVVGISALFLLKVLHGLFQVVNWYRKSEPDSSYDLPIRKTSGIKNSFTFFRLIFIDLDHFEDPEKIIRHERGHSMHLHSLDILFFHLLRTLFWWVPTIWLALRELKKIHEYEADQYALKSTNQHDYIKTLVHSTLKAHGLNLASSFDDAPIVKRLNFIKMMKKKISPWKVGSIMAIVIISGAMFACQDELDSEIQRISEESSQQVIYSDEVEAALKALQVEYPDQEFTVIETIGGNEESLHRLNEYDPGQIEKLFVLKEDGDQRIVMIVNKSSELFNRTLELQEKLRMVEEINENGGNALIEFFDGEETEEVIEESNFTFTIVENPASFPGGMEPFQEYLKSSIKYPKQARRLGVQGQVFVEFVVEKDGSLSDVQVLKGIGAGCDNEAKRVIEDSPNWEPGKQRGKKVRQKIVQKVQFRFSETE